jgi:undecaprenyl diphosphate synthase
LTWINDQLNDDKAIREDLLQGGKVPKHVAIIMDGNGRWAVERNKTRTEGHREGIESVRDIVKASSLLGINFLTLYAFSIENWNRPQTEVNILMKLLEYYLEKELDELHHNKVRVMTIGKTSALPKSVQKLLYRAIEKTKDNTGLTLTLALSYGGRWDIVRAVQMIALDVRRGQVSPEDINDEMFSDYLQTKELSDPDLLIRTSGELRLSNFLLWEMAYAEIYVLEKYWPEFRRMDLYRALESYMTRERRFGKTSQQVETNKPNDSYLKRVVDAFKTKK